MQLSDTNQDLLRNIEYRQLFNVALTRLNSREDKYLVILHNRYQFS